jgi:hypothetical protein
MSVFLLYADAFQVQGLLERLDRLNIPHGSKAPTAAASSERGEGATIVWGGEVSSILAQSGFVLNRPSIGNRCGGVEQMAELLHRHGVATAYSRYAKNKDRDYPFHYRVPVFHLQALTLFSAQSNAVYRLRMPIRFTPIYAETGLDRLDKRGASAVREAVKAIYALGLDFGVVDIVFPASGEPEVLSVAPYPELDDWLAVLYAEAISRFDRELKEEVSRRTPAMLGADPEFLLAEESGRIIHASRYLPKNGAAGCDVLTIRGVKRFPLAELRPEPTPDPRKLLRNTRRAMVLAADRILDDRLKWVAGGMPANGFALGGHLHMSRIWLNSRLLRGLDNYLALPLVLAEEAKSIRRRPRYGFLGDFRRQKHGGFEYRTLPSWLVSPGIARGVFASAALVAAHYKTLVQRPLDDPSIQKHYYEGNKKELLPIVKALWTDLERLPGYEALADWLDPYKQTILKMEAWDERCDFRITWRIPPFAGRVHDPSIRAIIGTGEMNVAGGGER